MTSRDDVEIYLATAVVAARIVDDDGVAERWEQDSVLEGMRVAGLAGHLARSILLTEPVLDEPPAHGTPLSTVEYYLAGGDSTDHGSPASRRVRETGEETAVAGSVEFRVALWDAIERLRERLPSEDLDARRSWFGRVTTVRTLLQARTFEMVVHVDDLCASAAIPVPVMPAVAVDLTINTLVGMARERHGDLAVIRALSRRERDVTQALRVL